jgi:predicted dehydrogenase
VAIYGCGRFANRVHIPNLLQIDGVEIVALCDVDPGALRSTARTFGVARTYSDGHRMLDDVEIDALYSVVPAYARTDVEATAAARGIHIFSEKPQALDMQVALRIDDAIRRGGVIGTVGFRERYRPIFQRARELLKGRAIVHVRFQNFRVLPMPRSGDRGHWWAQMDKSGGPALDWGVHATDYARFITGLDVARAQAFYCERAPYAAPLASSFNYWLSGGATMSMTFVSAYGDALRNEPWFVVLYEGGYLTMWRDRIEVDSETAYRAAEFDPWLAHDRAFIEAVRAGDGSALLNDYHDGLFSLAPVLAGWASARQEGTCIDVQAFMSDGAGY